MRTNNHSPTDHEPCSINLLPEFLVNQIKAGEVIERQASLVKEVIENSLDAGSTEVEINIVENGLDLISIKDNGKGISNLETIFEPFQTTKDSSKGLGLGLALSSNIISELGGMLQGKNRSSHGAEFKIILPLFDPSKIDVRDKNINIGVEP